MSTDKDKNPRIEMEPALDVWAARSPDATAREAYDKAQEHVEAQQKVPEHLRRAMMCAEISFWLGGSVGAPVAHIDDSGQHLAVPENVRIFDFVRDCLVDYAKQYVWCGGVTPEGLLWATYLAKDVEYIANCQIASQGPPPLLGEWSIIQAAKQSSDNVQDLGRPLSQKAGRNSRCPCGSGRKYKKCCMAKEGRDRTTAVSKEQFARRLIKAIRDAGADGQLDFDPDHFTILWDGKPQLPVEDLYDAYVNTPEWDRENAMQNFLEVWVASTTDNVPRCFDDVRDSLLPDVRGRGHYETFKLYAELHDNPLVVRPFFPLEEVVDDLLVPLDLYPPRYRVDDFPSPEQLQILRSEHNLVDRDTRQINVNAP
jgi:hypothetical protein